MWQETGVNNRDGDDTGCVELNVRTHTTGLRNQKDQSLEKGEPENLRYPTMYYRFL